jgi:ATP-dependent Clp endopeptidase proteolytic subunit ClpP
MKKSWYSMKAGEDSAEISIFDEIGLWGINATAFKKDWDEIKDKKNIRLMLNSPGGDVFDGMAIYNMISAKRENVEIEVYGLAASIASVIALAGDSLTMGEGTYLMIHNPWGVTIGDYNDHVKMAEVLEKMQGEFINIYANSSDLDKDKIKEIMDNETWMTAKEAAEFGFVDEVFEPEELAAMNFNFNKYGYAHVPGEISENAEPTKPETIRDFEAFLRDAGFSRKEAKAIASRGFQCDVEEAEDEQIEDHLIDDGDYFYLLTEIQEANIYE